MRTRSLENFRVSLLVFSLLLSVVAIDNAYAALPTMLDYSKLPPFLTADVKPNLIIAYDISGSMKVPAYNDTTKSGSWSKLPPHADFNPDYEYYGYFDICSNSLQCETEADHDVMYSYDTTQGLFYRNDATGDWSGNFLNWLSMRRADVARKVMIGGKVRDRAGEVMTLNGDAGPWYVLEGQNEPEDRTFTKTYASSNTKGLTPSAYLDGTNFLVSNGQIIPQGGGNAVQSNIQSTPGKSVEMGVVSTDWHNGDSWIEVNFLNTYTDPIVIAKPVSYNGADPMTIRVKDVNQVMSNGKKGFRIRPQEFPYKDGNHTSEDLFFIVAEAGHYQIATDNTTFEVDAQKFTSFSACGTNHFVNETFTSPFGAGTTPVLFTGVSSFDSHSITNKSGQLEASAAVITRNKNVSNSGFSVVMQEQEKAGNGTCSHGNEDIHAIGITPGTGVTDSENAMLEVGLTGVAVDENFDTITFASAFPVAPMVAMDMQTTTGSDSATLRSQNLVAGSVEVKVQEDQSQQSEQDHTNEQVGYIAANGGGAFNIKIAVKTEPTGLIQGMSQKVRFGLVVYNYDHTLNPTNIYNGNTIDGGTFRPCYPDISKPVDQRTNYDICRDTSVKAPIENMIDVIEDHPLIWGTTPTAETLYEAYGYLAQKDNNTNAGPNYYPNGTDNLKHCYGVGGSSVADNLTTQGACTAAGGVWDYSYSYMLGNAYDPYYYAAANGGAGGLVDCAKSFILNFNDGEPYRDWEGTDQPAVASDGDGVVGDKEFLDDMALYLRSNDLRTDAALPGYQEAISYYVLAALGEDINALQPRKVEEAAANGGFEDNDSDHQPDPVHPADFPAYTVAGSCTANEWDADADCFPDTFYFADDGYALAVELTKAFSDILQRMSSGTAASVISSSRSGEGAIYQAVFFPSIIDNNLKSIEWAGDVHSLWLDDYGNMREDCNSSDTPGTCTTPDHVLDLKTDLIVESYTDVSSGSARARLFKDANGDGSYDNSGTCTISTWLTQEECLANSGVWTFSSTDFVADNIKLSDLHYLWDGGAWLADASAAQKATYDSTTAERYIFTQFDDATGKPTAVEFSPTTLAAALTPAQYLAYMNASTSGEADKIVNFIRGTDQTGYRSRQIDLDNDGTVETWKLGDIVNSTPTVVSRPAENYDTIYNDESYRQFRKKYQYRRTMIYAGANDGALHAFNGGYLDPAYPNAGKFEKKFLKAPPTGTITGNPLTQSYAKKYDLGAEMWAFIPRNVLPHLKWLTRKDYNHVYYVDMKPYIFDAKIFDPSNSDHPGGWGTLLVGGMRFGGGDLPIDTDGDGTPETYMRSAYFILDITNPEKPPVVLAEFTDADLGFTVGSPTAIPMLRCDRYATSGLNVCPDNLTNATTWPMDWYLAFGSGPHDTSSVQNAMLGRSDQTGELYIMKLGGTGGAALPYAVDASGLLSNEPSLVTGYPKSIPAIFNNSFTTGVIAVDYDLDFRAESLYASSVANSDQSDHNLHTGGVYRLKVADDIDSANWTVNTFYDAQHPVVSSPAASFDGKRAWIYFGTGRFYDASSDKQTTAQQSYYGLKERYDSSGNLDLANPNGGNIVDVSNTWVENLTGTLSAPPSASNTGALTSTTFQMLDNEMSAKDLSGVDKYHGWKIDFDLTGERNLGEPAILGNIVTFATYVPSVDICEPEGSSYLWAPFYRTGTAFRLSVIGTYTNGTKIAVVRKMSLGKGMVTTPNIHTGAEAGSTVAVQTSTGAIKTIQQLNPGAVKSKIISWRDLGE